jgi:hypothetical protein
VAHGMSVAEEISKNRGQPATVRIGTVVSLSPLTVSLQQTNMVNMGVLDSYIPTVGDVVALLGQSAVSSDGSSWLLLGRPTDPVAGMYLARAVTSTTDAAGVSTLSAAYVALTAGFNMGVAFFAPSSGKALCSWRASTAPAAGATAWSSFRLGLGVVVGAGAVVQAPTDNVALMLSVTGSGDGGTSTLLLGLTPGAAYNVQMQHRTSVGTSFWARREITVIPVS